MSCIAAFSTASVHAGEVKISIANIPDTPSRIYIAAYKSTESMSANKPSITKIIEAAGNTMVVPLGGVDVGTYAFVAFADENSNGKLDTNIIGIPKERYGFSNNVMGLFGPPDFASASIQVGDEVKTIEIRLR